MDATTPTPGILYLVATPIGNLEDITLRALRILREVPLIAAEDTRHTRKLLNHYEIHTSAISYHDHSEPARIEVLLQRLLSGQSIALVTDAGTPGISDPGYTLVQAAIQRDIVITPIPGPSAVMAAVAASGLPSHSFVFVGFLPRQRSARTPIFDRLRVEPHTSIFFESPHRVQKTLQELEAVVGDRPAVIARELTKVFEEIWRGSLPDAVKHWTGDLRGEFVILVGGVTPEMAAAAADLTVSPDLEETTEQLLERLIAGGMTRRDAARTAASTLRIPFRQAYRAAMKLR